MEIVPLPDYREGGAMVTRTIGNMSGDWEELRDDFCYSFSLIERLDSLSTDILDFEN